MNIRPFNLKTADGQTKDFATRYGRQSLDTCEHKNNAQQRDDRTVQFDSAASRKGHHPMINNKEKTERRQSTRGRQTSTAECTTLDGRAPVRSLASPSRCRNHLEIFEQSKLSQTVQKVFFFFLLLACGRSARANSAYDPMLNMPGTVVECIA